MPINFPESPTTDDVYTQNDLSWKFNGTSWIALPTPSVAGNVAYTPAGTGAVATDVETKLRESVSVKDFGAVGDGVTDDTTAIANAKAHAGSEGVALIVPQGQYLVGGTVYNSSGGFTYNDDGFTGGINLASQARTNQMLFTSATPDTTPQDPADSRVPLSVTVQAKGSNHASGVRSNLVNESDDGNGCTAFYGRATNFAGANWGAAVHGETRHNGGTSIGVNSESAGYTSSGNMIGVNVHNTTGTGDLHPEDASASDASPSSAVAVNILGSGDLLNNQGRWGYGLRVTDNAMKTTGTAVAIECEATYGIDLRQASLSHAVALADGQKINFEDSQQVKLGYDSTASGGAAMEFSNGADTNIRLYNNGICDFRGDIRPLTNESSKLGGTTRRFAEVYSNELVMGGTGAVPLNISTGAGSPEGSVTAAVGSMYTDRNGSTGTTLYVKESGTGNTGWVAK